MTAGPPSGGKKDRGHIQKNQDVKMKEKKSLLNWIFHFAGEKKPAYIASIIFAILSVASSIFPYILMADIVQKLHYA